ncbi:MAG: hypothetical protein FJ137_04805 [Deltaproteobacteria bacterium]|nr:hypothetical protein [Deltaproteobacteria bacterium]
MRTSRPRGFALLIVMVLSVAMVVVAMAIVETAGHQEVASIHGEGAELARVLAESGLARADAWAIQTLKTNGSVDFDRVLDPEQDADCTSLASTPFNLSTSGSTPRAGLTTFLPRFSDSGADVVEFPAGSGRRWRRVPADRGAYLVRYEDNADDSITPGGDWSPRTGNNLGISNCTEGPAGAENLARDRDGAIWANVIGLYPGTNPVTAVHRVLLRKLIRVPASSPGGPAFHVGGNLDNVEGNNDVGGMMVRGNLSSSEGFCGRVSVQGDSNASGNSDCSPTPNPFVDDEGATVPAPTIPGTSTPFSTSGLAENAAWYDWTSHCNFYVRPNVGLFFWDASRTACANHTGNVVPPNNDPSAVGGCWVPILLRAVIGGAEDALPYGPFAGRVARPSPGTGCAEWMPDSFATPTPPSSHTDPGGTYSATSFTGTAPNERFATWFSSSLTLAYPDFSACWTTNNPSQLRWPATITPTTPSLDDLQSDTTVDLVSCGGSCDGATATLRICPAQAGREVQFLENFAAYVPGVLYKEGNYAGSPGFASTPPSSVNGARTVWPMLTLIVQGDMTTDISEKLWLGVGTRKSGFPSLVVGGNLDATGSGTADLRLLGGVYVKGNLTVKKDLTLYGPVSVGGNVATDPGGKIEWDYDYDFRGDGAASAAGPEPIVTFPVSL